MANVYEIVETLNFLAKDKIYKFSKKRIKINKNKNYKLLKKILF